MSIKKKIAVLGLGTHQLDALKYIKNIYDIVGFDEDKSCPGKKYAKKFYNFRLYNKDEIINICKKEKIIFATSFCTEFFLQLSFEINFKINKDQNFEIIKEITNKKACKEKIFKLEPSILPKFISIDKNNVKKILIKNFLPSVIKPVYGSGSKGVTFIKNKKELHNTYEKNKKIYKKGALIEEYIPGTEYAIDGWVYQNKFQFCCLSKKETSKKPSMLDTALIVNYRSKKLINLGKTLVEKLIKIFNFNNVPVHVEFKIKKGVLKLIDFSTRGPGFGVYTNIMSKIIRMNTTKIQIDLMRNKEINFKNKNQNFFYLYFLHSKPGKLIKFEGLEKIIRKCKAQIKLFKKIGDISTGYKSGNDRIGQIVIQDNDINNLKKKIKFIKNNTKIYVK